MDTSRCIIHFNYQPSTSPSAVHEQSLNLVMHAGMQHLQRNTHDNGWSQVGSKGRHKHVPNMRSLAAVTMTAKDSKSALAPAPPLDSTLDDCSFSLLSLPAIALASIFHNLDSTSSYQLAQTCRACAVEFTLQKSDLPRKCCSEFLPVVTRTPATQQQPYGSSANPIVLQLHWNEPSALSKIYALASEPCFMWDLWRHTWPEALWSDLLADGLPEVWPEAFIDDDIWERQLQVRVEINVTSDELMQLAWTWLAEYVVRGSATALTHYLKNKFGKVLDGVINLQVSLFRPAKAGHSQLIMRKYFGYHEIGNWDTDDDTCSVHSVMGSDTGLTYKTPLCLQKVAITGKWCPELPDAHGLWEAHCGDKSAALSAFTFGDQIDVGLCCDCESTYGLCGYEDDAYSYWFGSMSDGLEEFDYIDDGLEQPNWNFKRKEAKVKGSIKKGKAARRKSKVASK